MDRHNLLNYWLFICAEQKHHNIYKEPASHKNNMGIYKYLKQAWKKPRETLGQGYRQKLIQFRTEPVTLRIGRPTRLNKARALGYKPKLGVVLVRQKVLRGGHTRPKRAGGRRAKKMTNRMTLMRNYQAIAEMRANKQYKNCEVLNSYLVGKDGKSYWYEVILVDRTNPAVLADRQLAGIARQRGRVYRGLTSSARKSRGLRRKGKGAEKARPSRRKTVAIVRKSDRYGKY